MFREIFHYLYLMLFRTEITWFTSDFQAWARHADQEISVMQHTMILKVLQDVRNELNQLFKVLDIVFLFNNVFSPLSSVLCRSCMPSAHQKRSWVIMILIITLRRETKNTTLILMPSSSLIFHLTQNLIWTWISGLILWPQSASRVRDHAYSTKPEPQRFEKQQSFKWKV